MRGDTIVLGPVIGEDESDPVYLDADERGDVTIAQFQITGTVVLNLEGRVSSNAPWVELLDDDVTTSSIKAVATVREMRLVNKSGTDGGGVSAAYLQ